LTLLCTILFLSTEYCDLLLLLQIFHSSPAFPFFCFLRLLSFLSSSRWLFQGIHSMCLDPVSCGFCLFVASSPASQRHWKVTLWPWWRTTSGAGSVCSATWSNRWCCYGPSVPATFCYWVRVYLKHGRLLSAIAGRFPSVLSRTYGPYKAPYVTLIVGSTLQLRRVDDSRIIITMSAILIFWYLHFYQASYATLRGQCFGYVLSSRDIPNLPRDAMLSPWASWLLHLGGIDGCWRNCIIAFQGGHIAHRSWFNMVVFPLLLPIPVNAGAFLMLVRFRRSVDEV
jgi:hypothetical protein